MSWYSGVDLDSEHLLGEAGQKIYQCHVTGGTGQFGALEHNTSIVPTMKYKGNLDPSQKKQGAFMYRPIFREYIVKVAIFAQMNPPVVHTSKSHD